MLRQGMVALGISEFTFGYAFLHEQTVRNWGNLRVAPILPSLQQEADAGWDAHLPTNGTDFYYQFKLSEKLVRGNARERQSGLYQGEYYRFYLHAKDGNRQHRMLWRNAQINPETYYVAPEFDSLRTFNHAFLNHQVTQHSRLIPVNQCIDYLPTDNDQHYITYEERSTRFTQHSEPHHAEGSKSAHSLEEIYTKSKQRWRPIDEAFATRILNQTREKLDATADEEDASEDERVVESLRLIRDGQVEGSLQSMLVYSARILSVIFGVTMVIVGENQPIQEV